MAARGTEAKEKITNQILSSFPGAFKYEKEIRIPVEENGEIIQIKIVLTAAKTNVSAGGDVALPGESVVSSTVTTPDTSATTKIPLEPTEEEKQNVSNLLKMLGL